jgi:hypothetical protein
MRGSGVGVLEGRDEEKKIYNKIIILIKIKRV